MRSFSLLTIILLCIVILIVDVLAYYWLQSITQLFALVCIKNTIHIMFWVFTIGLITALLILKVRLKYINPYRKQAYISSFYGLTISSLIPKIIFIIIISILYAFNFIFSEKQSLIIIPLVGLFSGFIPFFIIINGIFRTLYRFKVYTEKIAFKNLPLSFNDLRIVHISDTHLGSFNYRYKILDKAIKRINDLKPDIICFTGDLVNNYSWELQGWENVFNTLEAKKGKYAVLGNHDYGDYSDWNSSKEKEVNFKAIKQFYKDIGFKLLLNNAIVLSENKDNIAIIGVENWGLPPFKQYGNLQEAVKNVAQIPFKILLTHNPMHWNKKVLNKTNISLTLSGHTHGMQAGIKYKSKQWSPIKYKYKYWAGLYNENEQYLYVNRGLGWLGFPGRLGMHPEITLIKLQTII